MIETGIVMVGLCILAWILSKADIKITIVKKEEGFGWQPKEVIVTKTAESKEPELKPEELPPTFDDVVKEFRAILGGDLDAE